MFTTFAEFRRAVRSHAAGARRRLKAQFDVNGLLADATSNPKVAKSLKIDAYTVPMHLAPARLSGYNTCARATAGCSAACLHTAGNPLYMQAKHRARINRTQAYFRARNDFMIILCAEILREQEKARKVDMQLAVRLNATSDIPWEKVSFTIGDVQYANIMEAFPNVNFYDYTKISNRRNLPANYSLTFSLAEDNDVAARQAIDNGMNVAVVFATKRAQALPGAFRLVDTTFPVLDGDVHDYRPADAARHIVGLRAKGDARTDESGFVRDPISH